jgi:hypothetical protein
MSSVDLEETDSSTTVSDGPVSLLMYYLSCIASTTSLPIPLGLVDDQHPQFLSEHDLSVLINLASALSPEIMIAAHIFIVDKDHSICTTSLNRFFEMTDQEVASVACSEAVLTGERVSVTKIMVCTPEWLKAYYYDPMTGFREQPRAHSNEPGGRRRCFQCMRRFFLFGFPLNSPVKAERILAWFTFIPTVSSLIFLIGFPCCYSFLWMEVYSFFLDLFMGTATMMIVIGYFTWFFIRGKTRCYANFWFIVITLVTMLPMYECALCVNVAASEYEQRLPEVWSRFSWYRLRNKIETSFECCGWQRRDDSPIGGCNGIQLCESPVMSQVRAFIIALTIGFGVMAAPWFFLVVVGRCILSGL